MWHSGIDVTSASLHTLCTYADLSSLNETDLHSGRNKGVVILRCGTKYNDFSVVDACYIIIINIIIIIIIIIILR